MKINDIIIKLLLRQPFYGYIASSISIIENSSIEDIKMFHFPMLTLYYNKDWFDKLDENQAMGTIIHEMLHLILMHSLRRGERDKLLWESACDMAVNEYLDEKMLSSDALTVKSIEKNLHYQLPRYKSAEFYYEELNKLKDNISLLDTDRQISIKIGNSDQMLVKKQGDLDYNVSDINRRVIESMLNQILLQITEESEIPLELTEYIEDVYRDNNIDWKNIFKRFLIGRGRIESRKSYKKESRRYENFPGNKRAIGLKCLLAIDESGSIHDYQIINFYNEIMEINRITSAEIYVTEFDTTCSKPVLLENYVKSQQRNKNGGTDFRPVFELADEMHIELLVFFTDGDGITPQFVNQRVLWVLTKGGKKPADYGFEVKL